MYQRIAFHNKHVAHLVIRPESVRTHDYEHGVCFIFGQCRIIPILTFSCRNISVLVTVISSVLSSYAAEYIRHIGEKQIALGMYAEMDLQAQFVCAEK